ncbi:MAG: hypothetical protein GY754_33840 [bacterium]|nr:hypothetical protein [bacterium]
MDKTNQKPNYHTNIEECLDEIITRLNKKICIGIGCGVGKPVNLMNALYLRAKADPEIDLTIISALTLEKPVGKNDLQKRLLEPMMARIFKDAPDFEHVLDLRKNRLPKNVKLYEWMLPPGGFVMHDTAQRMHVAGSFSDSPRDIISKDMNICSHMAASAVIDGKKVISGGSDADVVSALVNWSLEEKKNSEKLIIAEVNENVQFLWGDMIYDPETYDYIFEGDAFNQMPFCPPKEAISDTDHMMGFYASLLVKDGGTLQLGIGSLGDAITNGIFMRHKQNDMYKKLIESSKILSEKSTLINSYGGHTPFSEGLFCDSEMFVDSFLDLYDEGIIKRKVYDDYFIQKLINEKKITADININMLKELWDAGAIGTPLRENEHAYLVKHGILKSDAGYSKDFLTLGNDRVSTDLETALSDESFKTFLGTTLTGGEIIHATLMIAPKQMHERLEKMSMEERKQFSLRNVKFVNTLDFDEAMKREQRKDGRFINFGLVATLTGAVASETIKNQQVISGVGGLLDFVIMANAMDNAKSIMMLNATRGEGKEVQSNIVFEYSGCSVPRQLRDIIITEYGIAALQGCSDEECVIEMLKIADSRFQDKLLAEAKKYKKISADYILPHEFKNNYPEKISGLLKEFKDQGFYEVFPFGSDLTDEEYELATSLKSFVVDMRDNKFGTLFGVVPKLFGRVPEKFQKHVERMDLLTPKNFNEKFQRAVVLYALGKS